MKKKSTPLRAWWLHHPVCEWKEDPDGYWYTGEGCEIAFEFVTGGPSDNGFKYCPFCGRLIHEKSIAPDTDSD